MRRRAKPTALLVVSLNRAYDAAMGRLDRQLDFSASFNPNSTRPYFDDYRCLCTVLRVWPCTPVPARLIAALWQWAQDWFVVNLPNLAALVISIGFTLMLGGVWFFQSYLIATGQTSWEVLRARSVFYLREVPERVYPFSRGCWGNIASVCLRDSKRRAPDFWEMPGEPYGDAQRFWWIENEYWNCF